MVAYSKGQAFVGSIRILNYRMKMTECKRKTTVARYLLSMKTCTPRYYDDETMDTADNLLAMRSGASWGTYWRSNEAKIPFSAPIHGQFGAYSPYEGYKQDLYPYDLDRAQYRKYLTD